MPPKMLFDLSSIDLCNLVVDQEGVREKNAQRYEMEQLNGIIHIDFDEGVIVGVKECGEDEFWVRGHIPGRPLLPGVLMCELAAQICSYYYLRAIEGDQFLGFGGMTNVKFRGQVLPGDRLIMVARKVDLTPRRATFDCQGFVDGRMVYQGRIIGMPV